MLKGSTCHEDFCGHKGTIKAGDLQVGLSPVHTLYSTVIDILYFIVYVY